MPKLSIIFGYRNRDLERIERCLTSLDQQQEKDFEVLFVDYGSDLPLAKKVETLAGQFDFVRYLYTDTRGWPWNRSRALNIGIQQAKADYLMTTDIDMIYPSDFVEKMMDGVNEKKVRHLYHYFLPKGYKDWNKLSDYKKDPADKTVLGACHLVHKKHMEQLRGFDEYFCYWGVEDRDLSGREKQIGLDIQWMNDHTYMHHQWHATVNYATPGFMPEGWWFRMENYFYQNKKVLERNPNQWGQIKPTTERPVFNWINFEKKNLRFKEKQKVLNIKPYQNRSLTTFFAAWESLPSGHLLVLKNAFYPFNKRVPRLLSWLKVANEYSKFLFKDVDISKNLLHRQVYQFCLDNADQIADYYIGLAFEDGLTLIQKK